jgi:hypothetical protein
VGSEAKTNALNFSYENNLFCKHNYCLFLKAGVDIFYDNGKQNIRQESITGII